MLVLAVVCFDKPLFVSQLGRRADWLCFGGGWTSFVGDTPAQWTPRSCWPSLSTEICDQHMHQPTCLYYVCTTLRSSNKRSLVEFVQMLYNLSTISLACEGRGQYTIGLGWSNAFSSPVLRDLGLHIVLNEEICGWCNFMWHPPVSMISIIRYSPSMTVLGWRPSSCVAAYIFWVRNLVSQKRQLTNP